jgi:hypothetical protein
MNSFVKAFKQFEKTDLFEDYFTNHVLIRLIKDFQGYIDGDIFADIIKTIQKKLNITDET